MNADKRAHLLTMVEVIQLVLDTAQADVYERTHDALRVAIHSVRTDEYHKLQNMRKHEGKNASTDKQIELSIHCLFELDAAVQCHEDLDYIGLKRHLERASLTEVPAAKPVKKKSTTGLRKRRA
ncbi:hypothetical protein H3N89_gp59 [Microbacterium phage MonChoix]|uniref:Uncharacterized protein n=1 Tax=Microbacterium phage MonChoix TaxID=2590880 RepID=A0A4Y6EMG7_9CAUD|nr:hypothetical protein H3N89_gp59 [Microbacterium phage MonChoix]QDF16024.1 hypothetical protein SEA_MONCHOIX_59 [Microbacterium phage MonChoix]